MTILGNRVIAKEVKKGSEKVRESGIVIPETVDTKTNNIFVVVAVGNEVENEEIREGSYILLGDATLSTPPNTVPLKGDTLTIFKESQIVGVENETGS